MEADRLSGQLERSKEELIELQKNIELLTCDEVNKKFSAACGIIFEEFITKDGFYGDRASKKLEDVNYELLKAALRRIFEETNMKEILDETIGSESLFNDLAKKQWPVSVVFGADLGANSGEFNRDNGISVASSYTNPFFILNHLASDGYDDIAKTLTHEYIHHYQNLARNPHKMNFFYSIFSQPRLKSLISELHAFMSANRLASKMQDNTAAAYAGILKKNYGLEECDTHKIEVAFSDIKKLFALNVSETEIAAVVVLSHWNQAKNQWDSISQKVAEAINEQGVTDEDLKKLVDINDIQCEINLFKTMKIAREEILQFSESY